MNFCHRAPALAAAGAPLVDGVGACQGADRNGPTALLQSVGYIIPGLIAYWMMRQGVVETLCTMFMAAFIVRLALVAAHGGRIIELAIG